jgi:putative membrane protein
VSLFSARVFQHMWLATVVAPLIALGRPQLAISRLAPRAANLIEAARRRPLAAAAAFAGALWFWHAPGPYTATFESDLAYWVMHLSSFAAALWLWSSLLDPPAEADGSFAVGPFALAMLLTSGQMGLLGALITFAGQPLYPPHLLTTYVWELSPLADQQLGGVVMWVPAGVLLAAGFAFAFMQVLRRAEEHALQREA